MDQVEAPLFERIAIVGSREFPSPAPIEAFVATLPAGTVIVSGGARGVDTWAAEAGRAHGLEVVEFLADWERHGRAAGPIRNAEIVRQCDRVVAFWDGKSHGTLNTAAQAIDAGKPVEIRDMAGTIIPLADVRAKFKKGN